MSKLEIEDCVALMRYVNGANVLVPNVSEKLIANRYPRIVKNFTFVIRVLQILFL